MKQSFGEKLFHILILVVLAIIALTMLLPFINLVALSLSGKNEVIRGEVFFWPKGFQLDTYKGILSSQDSIRMMLNTIYITILGTSLSVLLTAFLGYGLSKKFILIRSVALKLIVFTMLFSPGIIPTYLVVRNLGLIDSMWSLMIPVAINPFNLIIMKTFFQSLPPEVEESAIIDGASTVVLFFLIVVPLCMHGIATMILFYAVERWNTFFNAIIYLTQRSKYPLQVILQEILALNTELAEPAGSQIDLKSMPAENMKAAVIIFATVPIIVFYPILQKYFVKGVMIGSIKG